MDALNLPEYEYRIEQRAGKLVIFDPIRKKFIVLTPEEWVRQHFVNFMVNHLGYPMSLMRVESGTSYNKRAKRTDVLVYDRDLKPQVLVECKAASVAINQSTFDQIATYNKTLGAPVLVCTNGLTHYACIFNQEKGAFEFLDKVPAFDDLTSMI